MQTLLISIILYSHIGFLMGMNWKSFFLESGDFNNYNQASLLQKVITENKKKYNSELENISFDTPVKFILNEVITCLSNLSRETKDYKKTNEIAIKEAHQCFNDESAKINHYFTKIYTFEEPKSQNYSRVRTQTEALTNLSLE